MTDEEKDSLKLLERVSMFNDAVYAIILTLLVLELKFPEDTQFGSAQEMLHGFKELTPKLMAFLLSILTIGGAWISSVHIQRQIIKANTTFMIYIVIYLSLMSLTPFTCNIIGNFPENPISYVACGAVNIFVIINAIFFLRHNRKQNLYHPDTDIKSITQLEKSIPFTTILIMIMVVVAFYNTYISLTLFIIYALLPFFLTKSLKIHHK